MANSERMALLSRVREAKAVIRNKLDQPDLTDVQRKILNDLYDVLLEMDDILVLQELNDSIGRLEKNSKLLKQVNARAKKQIEKLKDIADTVDQVAKAVDAVVKAFGILLSAGIL